MPNDLTKLFSNQGLLLLGVVPLDPQVKEFQFFKSWLKEGKHAGMKFLEEHLEVRANPKNLEQGCDKAIVFALPYNQEASKEHPQIAQYARLRDYHKVLKRKVREIIGELNMPGSIFRICIDSAPLLEKPLAATLEQCFTGKNTLLIHKDRGSFLLLGFLLTNMELDYSPLSQVRPHVRDLQTGGCGTCKRCQVHCPTGALDQDYVLDARKCLAYYTIEHRGLVPLELWPHFRGVFFGCDLCQSVCPYNRRTPVYEGWRELLKISSLPPLYDIATMDQAYYEKTFGGTPMTRAKKTGLQRNALICMAAREDPGLKSAVAKLQEGALDETLAGTIAQILEFIVQPSSPRALKN